MSSAKRQCMAEQSLLQGSLLMILAYLDPISIVKTSWVNTTWNDTYKEMTSITSITLSKLESKIQWYPNLKEIVKFDLKLLTGKLLKFPNMKKITVQFDLKLLTGNLLAVCGQHVEELTVGFPYAINNRVEIRNLVNVINALPKLRVLTIARMPSVHTGYMNDKGLVNVLDNLSWMNNPPKQIQLQVSVDYNINEFHKGGRSQVLSLRELDYWALIGCHFTFPTYELWLITSTLHYAGDLTGEQINAACNSEHWKDYDIKR